MKSAQELLVWTVVLKVELKNIPKASYISEARYDSYNGPDCNVIWFQVHFVFSVVKYCWPGGGWDLTEEFECNDCNSFDACNTNYT